MMQSLQKMARPALYCKKGEKRFIDTYNSDVVALNRLINDFNSSSSTVRKTERLATLYQQAKALSYKYPANLITQHHAYIVNIHQLLFHNLCVAYKELGLDSLWALDPDTKQLAGHPAEAFAKFIAHMHPRKVSAMLALLSAGIKWNQQAFAGLYRPDEEGYAAFRTVYERYTIDFLGGINSKNFKITLRGCKDADFVLKVDNRLNMPRSVEASLRKTALRSTLTTIYAERQATYTTHTAIPTQTTSTLLLTEFCKGKDLESAAMCEVSDDERISSALNIYSQMIKILSDIKDVDCFFPDMKNSNWLIHDEVLRIADTKSFLFAKRRDGLFFWRKRFDARDLLADWCQMLTTPHMVPLETFSGNRKFSVNKFHLFLLGKNLYQYLTKCPNLYLYGRHDGNLFSFSLPIFTRSEVGQELKKLIIALVKPEASKRMNMVDAKALLETIQQRREQQRTLERCRHLLESMISDLSLGEGDVILSQYVHSKERVLRTAEVSTSVLQQLSSELETMSVHLRKAPWLDIIKKLPQHHASMYVQAKVNEILTQLRTLSLTQRRAPLSSNIVAKIENLYAHQEKMREAQQLVLEIKIICGRNERIKRTFSEKKEIEINALDNLAPLIDTLCALLSSLKRVNSAVDAIAERINVPANLPFSSQERVWYQQQLQSIKARILTVAIEVNDSRSDDIKRLNLLEKQVNCLVLIKKITQLGFNSDTLMAKYKLDMVMHIKKANTEERLQELKCQLEKTLAGLGSSIPSIKSVISDFHRKASFFSQQMHAKAKRIESAITAVPVEMRGRDSLRISDSEKVQNLRLSLASHRHFFRKNVYIKADGDVDENLAAASYKRFFQLV